MKRHPCCNIGILVFSPLTSLRIRNNCFRILLNLTKFGLEIHFLCQFGTKIDISWVANQLDKCNYNIKVLKCASDSS